MTVTDEIIVPDNYGTIQAAINAAGNGDTIVVKDGTYTESIEYKGKEVSVESVSGPTSTTISGQVQFKQGEASATIEGFTVTTTSTTGIIYISGTQPTIDNCIIENNTSGPGVYALGERRRTRQS